jgi:hypothetical protein
MRLRALDDFDAGRAELSDHLAEIVNPVVER